MKRNIILAPQNILTHKAKTVTDFDHRLQQILKDMSDTLTTTRNPKGVGLAASQIGVRLRIFITRPTAGDSIRAFINPKIINTSDNSDVVPTGEDKKMEGCLSVPKVWGHVARHHSLVLEYMDAQESLHQERFDGFMATIIQHETDHTNGILFTQRILEQKGKLYQAAAGEDGKEVLEEIQI